DTPEDYTPPIQKRSVYLRLLKESCKKASRRELEMGIENLKEKGNEPDALEIMKTELTSRRNKGMTQEEKDNLVYIGVLDCFAYYVQHKSIEAGKGYVYDYFYERKRLPKHTPEFRARIKELAQKEVERDIKSGGITSQVKDALSNIQ